MKSFVNSIKKILPTPILKTLADRLFLITLATLILDGWLFGIEEGFICVVTALLCYLCNLEFCNKKGLLSRGVHLFLLSIISILLGAVNSSYIPIISPLYTFFLVIFERDEYHRGVPMFFLPLTIHLLSLGLPLNLIFQRSISISIGVAVALVANLWIWPSKSGEEALPEKREIFSSPRIKYSLRKSVGVAFVLMVGRLIGGSVAVWAAYLFLILHGPIDNDIFPKVGKRIGGTILGGLLYLPLGYLIESKTLIYILAVAALYFAFLFIGQCYFTAVTFITLNTLLYSVGTFSFEAVLSQRLLFAVLGGVAALAVSLLIPLKEEAFCPSVE